MKVFEPFVIGTMSLKNRLIMPPMVTNFGTGDGYVTDRTKDYYEARSRGGVGLIIVEASCIEAPIGKLSPHQLVIDDDRYIPGLRELARRIHQHGARAAIQLHHAGRSTTYAVTGCQPVSPSAIPFPGGELPRVLTVDEVKQTVDRFANAAGRAKKAGFDAVEIHAAHGYLISQFLSAGSNKRRDEYGGDLKQRAKILLDVIAAVKRTVGESYPVWCRINGREYGIESGITVDEAQEVARMCQAAGIAAVHVSVYAYGTDPSRLPIATQRDGYLVRFAEAVKRAVSIPVITVGGITPAVGEKVVIEGRADLLAIGRGLIADPELPKKAAEGRPEDIIPCILCGTCEDNLQGKEASLHCRVNPTVGRESEATLTMAERPKKVVVVGGGPAGMAVAAVSARRGHQVIIFEKCGELGGQLVVAAVPPYKDRLVELNRYLSTQVKKAHVSVELGKKATVADIESISPDVVVLATGSVPFLPEIPGIERSNVVTAEEVLAGEAQAGQKVVVIGGELVGCETAEFLAEAGKKVTITRRGPTMAAALAANVREPLVGRLELKGVTLLTGVLYERITAEGLVITDKEGQRRTLPADTIVLAVGSRPDTELLGALQGRVPEVYQIGDCLKPRSLLEALADGFQMGYKL